MRAFLCLFPVVLAGCATTSSYPVSQREILRQSQVEIARREPWAPMAAIFARESDDFSVVAWKVKAGAYERSDYPNFKGIYFVPGTERELQFSRSGCLLGYIDRGNRCVSTETTVASDTLYYPSK
jgi:hypothetical protein